MCGCPHQQSTQRTSQKASGNRAVGLCARPFLLHLRRLGDGDSDGQNIAFGTLVVLISSLGPLLPGVPDSKSHFPTLTWGQAAQAHVPWTGSE